MQSQNQSSARESFYQFPFEALQTRLKDSNLKPEQARLLYNWYYKKNRIQNCELFGVSKSTINFLVETLDFSRPKILNVQESDDKTVKFLFELHDRKTVESVLIPFNKKYTACLSSQVGCAMKCAFCFTGTQGFTRHLGTHEIIGQFLALQTWLSENRPNEDKILNVVFMGQGEPLHNFDSVNSAVKILISQFGLSIADHKITISTSGYLPGLLRWQSEMPSVNIALSLHSPFEEKRSKLIPINQKYSLHEILPIIEQIPKGKKRFVTYEYLLIEDFNDSEEDALATGRLLKGSKAFINLIPFNPFPGTEFRRPSEQRINKFLQTLIKFELPVTLRSTKGDQILAACGQLKSK